MSDEPKGTFISLTEFAEDCGKTPLNILRKSIRLQRSAFVRLKGQGTLTILDEVDSETMQPIFKNLDMKNQLWELPYRELEKLMIDMPPWHITSVVPPDIVQEDPKHFQFQFRGESINENDLFLLVPATDKTVNQTNPPLPAYQGSAGTGNPTVRNNNFFKNSGKNKSRTKNGNRAKHTLIIWDALQDCDEKLKSEAKPTQIWNFLRGNIVNYNNEEIIIKITHDQLTYFKNSGLESSMTKDTFRQTVARLRKNPPKRKP